MSDNSIERNKLVNSKFSNKTIDYVDATALNFWTFYMKDGTQIHIQVDAVYPSMGLYGIGISIAEKGFYPEETIGCSRKPGDARKEV